VSGTVRARAPARVALAGNPSDGYGGAVLSLAIANYGAAVTVRDSSHLEIVPAPQDEVRFGDLGGLVRDVRVNGYYGGLRLLKAAVKRFADHALASGHDIRASTFSIGYETDIPRAVGLGGSSAIVTAALRALCEHHGVAIGPEQLAELALDAERGELGIEAGLQDRVAQAFGGLTFMDFAAAPDERYTALDPGCLPPLFVAHLRDAGEPSERFHGDLRRRWEEGDPRVVAAMRRLAELAAQARSAVLAGDPASLGATMDATFEERRALGRLDPRHVELIERARSVAAPANFAGSGGAIVGVYRDPDHLRRVERELGRADSEVANCAPAPQLVHN
jgi:glucuronokinase